MHTRAFQRCCRTTWSTPRAQWSRVEVEKPCVAQRNSRPSLRSGPLAEVGLRRQYDAESAVKRERMHVKTFSSFGRSRAVSSAFRVARDASAHAGHGLYLGHDATGWHYAEPQHSVLVLGPPRSGKTSALLIPNVLSANGAVVTTSTKTDVLDATMDARSTVGVCHLFDPSGSVPDRPDVHRLRWSPLPGCASWRTALVDRPGTGRGRIGGYGRHPVRHLPLDRACPGTARSASPRSRTRGCRHAHGAHLGGPPPGAAGPTGAVRACRRRPGHRPRPARRHRQHRRTRAERHLVDGFGRTGRIPVRGGPGGHV